MSAFHPPRSPSRKKRGIVAAPKQTSDKRPVADIHRIPHRFLMSGLSKQDRMELRRELGNRAVREPSPPPYHRGPECLWPHACFSCRKSWKLAEASTAKCPECGGELHWMGRAFKVPRKTDKEQWSKVEALWRAGYRFINHTGWRDVEPYPDRLRDVEDFVRKNPGHPFRVEP